MRTLEQCELAIKKGFAEAGIAFKEIRDRKLYKRKYNRFEDYCQDVWKANRSYVNKLIRASKVIENLGTNGTQNLPRNEREIRPLTNLEPNDQITVWNASVETAPNNKPTAAYVSGVKAIFEKNSRDMEKPEVANLIKLVQSPEKLDEMEQEQNKELDRLLKLRKIKKEQNLVPLSNKLRRVYLRDFARYWEGIEEVRTNREQLDAARLHIDFLFDKYPILKSESILHIVEEEKAS
jgi:thiamine kinase-like enzyme